MKPRWVIASKELKSVFTERTILLAVVIQVVVAGFSSFLVLGLSALVDPDSLPNSTRPVVAVNGTSELALLLERAGFDMRSYKSDQEVMRAFHAGVVDAAVFVDEPKGPDDVANVELVLPDGDLRATMSLTQLKRSLEEYELALRQDRADRISFEPLSVGTDAKAGSYAFVYSLLIPLLVFLPVVLSGALCADSLTEEVQRHTLPLLLSSPATPADVIEGKLLANVAVTPILSIAWFGLLSLNSLHVEPLGGLLIVLMATAIAFVMGLLAAGIALATRDRNKAHVLYATAMFGLLAGSLALPVSPVNAIALLAAGSADALTFATVGVTVIFAAVCWLGLRLFLRRTASWMAAGS